MEKISFYWNSTFLKFIASSVVFLAQVGHKPLHATFLHADI